MPDRARAVVAAAAPAGLVAALWARLEAPIDVWPLLGMAALALLPAAVRGVRARALSAVAVAFAGVSVAFSASPLELLPRTGGTWLGGIASDVATGLRGFERLAPPFDAAERPTMHALVLLAVFAFSLVLALAVAASRPLLAAGTTALAGGWATASVGVGERELLVGALVLAAVVWPLLVLRARTSRDLLAGATAMVAIGCLGAGVAAAGVVPREPYLEWKSWSLLGPRGERIGVQYVWDAQYEGIRFPSKRTTVLKIRAERAALYWRASTLDLFTADRWLENLAPIAVAQPIGPLPDDPLVPERARDRDAWVEQEVENVRLDEDRLIGAGQPMRVEAETVGSVFVHSGGVMRAAEPLGPGERYRIWGYAPRPLPRDLLASKPVYPEEVRRYLAIDRFAVTPGFGEPGRAAVLDEMFGNDLYLALRAYRPLWEAAQEVARDAGSPYEATLAVERWLRSTGGFTYDEQPPLGAAPPLVDFVMRHRSGYCQHFAGTMTLMLRMLGVPARVAVGFTSGRYRDGVWEVADRDAHAWVEAWFDGHGWVTFDPTPGRGTLTAGYTFASDSADAIQALGRGALLDVVDLDGSTASPAPAAPAVTVADEAPRRGAWAALAAAAVGVLVAVLLATKAIVRRARYVTRDPRRLALAVRRELEDVLCDQRVPVRTAAGLGELREATERGLGVPSGALTEALGRARFGPPERAALAAQDARRELRRVLELARERRGPSRRVRGALSPRSLARRLPLDSVGRL